MIFFHLILQPTVPDFDIIIFLFIISSELLIKILLAHSEPAVSAPSQLFLGMSCHVMLCPKKQLLTFEPHISFPIIIVFNY